MGLFEDSQLTQEIQESLETEAETEACDEAGDEDVPSKKRKVVEGT